jgi:hypothetical protein
MPDFQVEVIETRLYKMKYVVTGVENADAAYSAARFEQGEYKERFEFDPLYVDTIGYEHTIVQIPEVKDGPANT